MRGWRRAPAGKSSARSYPGWMRHPGLAGWMTHQGRVSRAALSLAIWALVIIFSPVIPVAGEPINQYVMRRVRWSVARASVTVLRRGDGLAPEAVPVWLSAPASLLLTAISNPLWIALTAPGRWVSDQLRHRIGMDHG